MKITEINIRIDNELEGEYNEVYTIYGFEGEILIVWNHIGYPVSSGPLLSLLHIWMIYIYSLHLHLAGCNVHQV